MKFREYEDWGNFHKLEIDKGWKALDIGCGNGYNVAYLTALGLEAYGLDNASQGHQMRHENLILADAKTIPCKSNYFDLVLCSVVIQHIPESMEVMKEIRRVLNNKGMLVIAVANKWGITLKSLRLTLRNLFGLETGYDYFKTYTIKELIDLLTNSGFL